MKKSIALASVLVAGSLAGTAAAKVPEAQTNRLGNDLTPIGAEKAGNGGDIPAWTGGLTSVPDSVKGEYQAGKLMPNPFASDKPKVEITPANMGQYSDKLTEGYKALLTTYPDYKMKVYQTRRSCAYPEFVYEATKRNSQVADLTPGGNGVSKGIMGFPFPIPNNALEVIWNHTLRYRGFKLTREFTAAPVTRSGEYELITVQDEAILQWSDPKKNAAEELDNISLYYIANTVAPARSAGSVILVHETLNRAIEDRKAWQYSPGTRRVRRAPNIAYDNPGTNSDGLSTSDSFDGYNGAPDRYNWKVIGKSEKFVAANSYDATLASYDQLIKPLHLNQDYVRYENHRVWTIEATLKEGTRHVYSRRVKHLDEDSWTMTGAELYDGRGELWRVQELHGRQSYAVPLCNKGAEIVYDLQAGRYLALALQNEGQPINYAADELDVDRYTPAAIRRLGVR
ncbi:DUF1329 domain-containing protein [Tepidicaulis sp.]|jgi:hypothetical protein|uniref:DUF1329 domain-containing protein n=1 Tax=Tepidicaulis sp. TaxID=1920809 RepID=UPI003B5CF348